MGTPTALELEKLSQVRYLCPACGRLNVREARFCGTCGKPMPVGLRTRNITALGDVGSVYIRDEV